MPRVILVIDDDKDLLETIKDIMCEEGYEVRTLSDPTRAEECIDAARPDLLIIDIFMPKRSGFNILEDFKKKGIYGGIPKIFLTCLDDDIERMSARACGVTHYITKPFEPKELIRLVKKCIG